MSEPAPGCAVCGSPLDTPGRAPPTLGPMASALDRPCSARQIGTVHGQFRRLGLGDPGWRGCRLAIAGALTGRPGLGSIRALAGGEAGYLIPTLGGCRDCRDLAVHLAWAALEDRKQVARLASTSPAG